MKRVIELFVIGFLIFSCQTEDPNAQQIVDKAIDLAGGTNYENFEMTFDFRDKQYLINKDNGLFKFERHFKDSIGSYVDIVNNDGFMRYINKKRIEVADSMATRYTSSINSVQYFVLLPSGLNDAAVNKEYLMQETIKKKQYHKIRVTFNQEGGGEDFEDVFVYWIDVQTHKADYIAYSYNESDGIGMRFREAYNERNVNGIRIVDYNNYKSEAQNVLVEDLGNLFESNSLKLLSKIETENVEVILLNNQ
jgi:hypothetical protein